MQYDENFVSAKKVKKSLKETEAQDGNRTADPSWLDLLRQSQSHTANDFGGMQETQPFDVNLIHVGCSVLPGGHL